MPHFLHLPAISLALISGILASPAYAVDSSKLLQAKFTGSPSCSSTGCHGGGANHNEAIIYEHKDRHAISYGILGKGTSLRIAEALGIKGDPGQDARCSVCHAPMQGVARDRLIRNVVPDRGVGCESCHGPAENWIRFHTRPDVSYEQVVAAGLRDMNDIYGRANSCIGCHLNLDEPLLQAGHPELFFELDRQTLAEPPHYKDSRPSLGPRSWLTGQAASLREISWKLSDKKDEALVPRWNALVWLLRMTELGKSTLPADGSYAAMQTAADGMARQAAAAMWTKAELAAQLKEYVSTSEFEGKGEQKDLRRKAEVLMPAIDRLWRAWKKEDGNEKPTAGVDAAMDRASLLARQQDDFRPAKFADALQDVRTAVSTELK